jgi:peroxiredoxin
MGTSLVGISPQAPDDSLTTADRNELGFQVLSDVKGAVAAAYGLLYELPAYLQEVYIERGHPLPAFNRTDDWTLPIPATFVIGVDGEVRFAEAFVDYTYRTDPAEVIATVRRITGS